MFHVDLRSDGRQQQGTKSALAEPAVRTQSWKAHWRQWCCPCSPSCSLPPCMWWPGCRVVHLAVPPPWGRVAQESSERGIGAGGHQKCKACIFPGWPGGGTGAITSSEQQQNHFLLGTNELKVTLGFRMWRINRNYIKLKCGREGKSFINGGSLPRPECASLTV